MSTLGEPDIREIGAPVVYREPVILVRAGRGLLRFVRRKPLGAFGGFVVLVLIFLGLFGGELAPYRYDAINISERLQGPSSSHLFGTDDQGRDILSRLLYGARTSIIIGFGATAVGAILASVIGIVSGYYGGLLDLVWQRLVDIMMAFPGLIFLIFFVSIFGSDRLTLIIAIGLLFSAGSSRVVRGATMAAKQELYVEAATACGASGRRIMLQHILPNVFAVILIGASVQIGFVILVEASLSFLGFGIPPPFPSWGGMLQEAQNSMRQHPTIAIFPGAAIAITVYAFNMFGDAVRDVLDPRLRGGR